MALAGVVKWIEHRLQTKGSLVWFPVREHAWIAGWVPRGGHVGGNHNTDVSLPLFLPPFPLSKNK